MLQGAMVLMIGEVKRKGKAQAWLTKTRENMCKINLQFRRNAALLYTKRVSYYYGCMCTLETRDIFHEFVGFACW